MALEKIAKTIMKEIAKTSLIVLVGTGIYSSQISAQSTLTYNQEELSRKKEMLKKYTPLTKEEIERDTLFSELGPGLKTPLLEDSLKIYILNDSEICFLCGSISVACTNPLLNYVFFPKNFSKKTLVHEAAHVRHFYLNKRGSDFEKKWKEIHNVKYEIDKSKGLGFGTFLRELPKNGDMEGYGSLSIYEDVATFVEQITFEKADEKMKECVKKEMRMADMRVGTDSIIANKIKKYSSFSEYMEKEWGVLDLSEDNKTLEEKFPYFYERYLKFSQIKNWNDERINVARTFSRCNCPSIYFANPMDKRYKEKINLLKEYGFITESEHKTLIGRMGKMYFLLNSFENDSSSK